MAIYSLCFGCGPDPSISHKWRFRWDSLLKSSESSHTGGGHTKAMLVYQRLKRHKQTWLVVSNIFYFHPYFGKIPILTNIFQMCWDYQPETHFWVLLAVRERIAPNCGRPFEACSSGGPPWIRGIFWCQRWGPNGQKKSEGRAHPRKLSKMVRVTPVCKPWKGNLEGLPQPDP